MRVLLAVDLREDAATLVRLAEPWARRLGAEVGLVYADGSRAGSRGLFRRGLEITPEQLAALRAADEEEMEGLLELLPMELRGRVISTEGDAAEILARLAADADALVLGTHGRAGLEHAWLGSVAEKVVRTAPGAVLVLRDGALRQPARVLVAVERSEASRQLVQDALPWVERLDAVVDLVHADERYAFADDSLGADARRKIEDEALLTSFRDVLPLARRGRVILAPGAPAPAVTALATGYDLLICGTHGRTGFARAWLGSVAERVVRTAPGPVLLLKPR
jgi:nucleotide-binding universal stress UspA family protein